MATLILSTAGSIVGGALGGPAGAVAGRALGALAGGAIDGALTNRRGKTRIVEGPRLDDLDIQASREGAPVPRAYGRVRLAGHLIWGTRLEEEVVVSREGGGGGGKGGRGGKGAKTRTYNYYANFAVGLCEGPISRIGRVWADGKPLDLTEVTMRVYTGAEDQQPDSLITAKQGASGSPAYRGLAYVVFERMPLKAYGNRLPQLSFEIVAAVGALERKVRAVTVIPGSSEFAYSPTKVRAKTRDGYRAQNRAILTAGSDWTASIDELTALCPNLSRVALVTSWFGTDLRAGACQVRPGVEVHAKTTLEGEWSVNGVARADAHLVSRLDGRPAFGGTPADWTVVDAIQDLKRRGVAVTVYPFLLMDVPADSTLPSPYGGVQPAYPWRGRVTCHPAPGMAGSPDRSSTADRQVSAFFGAARASDFTVTTDEDDRPAIAYGGPDEWGWRRMILHHAALAKAAGGVDAFLIGSEMRGLTTIRGAAGYPAVAELVALLGEVRQMLGPDTKISYAADWSEYFGHQPSDGSGDVAFHLDPLWADANCDFVGIDNYMPFTDWRDGTDHADAAAGSAYDRSYIAANITGGEGHDWYYASDADRAAQSRTPITDGAGGKPWVYRYKDLASWWTQPHVNRVGGAETNASPWVPGSKPIWFTEIGVPAIDKGGNQPNVFFDPKSSESFVPHHSAGTRDDFAQRRGLETALDVWAEVGPHNPVSAAGRMVNADTAHAWTWDARPFPAYPLQSDIWSDGENWLRGHWLTGRLGQAPLAELIAAILRGGGIDRFDVSEVHGVVDGYVVDRPMPLRDALEPLSLAFALEVVERGDTLVFRSPASRIDAAMAVDDLVAREGVVLMQRRAQESELPARVRLGYTDLMRDHGRAAVGAVRGAGGANEAGADLPIVSNGPFMTALAETWLRDIWTGRNRSEFVLPPSLVALEAGDTVSLLGDGSDEPMKLEEVGRGGPLRVEGRRVGRDQGMMSLVVGDGDLPEPPPAPVTSGPPDAVVLALPRWREEDAETSIHVAAHATPWPSEMTVWVRGGASYAPLGAIAAPATLGRATGTLRASPPPLWDGTSVLDVELQSGNLQSLPDLSVLNGANMLAVQTATGWEIVQFANADLIGERTYRLTRLLRGRFGTDARTDGQRGDALVPEAIVVLLDEAVTAFDPGLDAVGRPFDVRIGVDAAAENSLRARVVPGAEGARPFAPVHVKARRVTGGIELSWIRRARRGGDSWFLREVPLSEPSERYAVEIARPTGSRRVETSEPRLIYPDAMIADDFVSEPDRLDVRVAQIGELIGDGAWARATLDL